MHYIDTIPAGGTLRIPNLAGSLFLLTDIGTASEVDVVLSLSGKSPFRAPRVGRGFRAYFRETTFDGIEIAGVAGTIVQFFVASEDIQISTTDGATVSVPAGVAVTNTNANRVPVDIGGAVINVTATNVGINNTPANAVPVDVQNATLTVSGDVGIGSPTTLADIADVAIASVTTAQVIAAAGVGVKEREVIVKSLAANTSAIRVGAATATAGRGVELLPGEAVTLNTLAAVYAYNVGAVAQSVSVVTVSR